MNANAVTVITLTSGRVDVLHRAIRSVQNQDYDGPVEHLVVADDCPHVIELADTPAAFGHRRVRVLLVPRIPHERGDRGRARASVYPRLARLLNIGVRHGTSAWVAFLDDDNEYLPDHISSLHRLAAESGSGAVHSARAMVWPDGSPYLEPFFPGAPNAEEGARIYGLMCRRGVWIEGTNILQDRVDERQVTFHNSTLLGEADPVFLVDQNLWLIERNILLKHPVPEVFSDEDIAKNTCPDDKMLEVLVRNDVPIRSTRRPTVRYYLGGISNGGERTPAAPAQPT